MTPTKLMLNLIWCPVSWFGGFRIAGWTEGCEELLEQLIFAALIIFYVLLRILFGLRLGYDLTLVVRIIINEISGILGHNKILWV